MTRTLRVVQAGNPPRDKRFTMAARDAVSLIEQYARLNPRDRWLVRRFVNELTSGQSRPQRGKRRGKGGDGHAA